MQSEPHYESPLGRRYASQAMTRLFSEETKIKKWREVWIVLADEQRKLGLPITKAQVAALERVKDRIDMKRARDWELKLKHDVMAHLKTFAALAPKAEPIMHLGATSAFITDNAEALIYREAVELLQRKLLLILSKMQSLILKHAGLDMTGYTHFQPAQPVTLGKRIGLWAQDILWDYEELNFVLSRYEPLGCKGTTGTQASFMVLFKGNMKKVQALDEAVVKRLGFDRPVALSGQTLSRKADTWFLQSLSNLAASFSKMGYDMRLLQHTGEVREPFGKEQVGSSAMPYKQNPMLAERICGLSRFLMVLSQTGPWTHATQWLERSLDDSSCRRMSLPEAFLTADSLCESVYRLVSGLRVDEATIDRHLARYRPMFETEAEMMEGTLKGGSRQDLHERIRQKMLRGDIKNSQVRDRISGLAREQAQNFATKTLGSFLKREWKLRQPDEQEFSRASV